MKKKITVFAALAASACLVVAGCAQPMPTADTVSGSDDGSREIYLHPEEYEYTVLSEDDICTFECAGIGKVYVSGTDDAVPVFQVKLTNNSGRTFTPAAGTYNPGGKAESFGTMNGGEVHTVKFADSHTNRPYLTGTFPSVTAGDTLYFYICPFLEVTSYPAEEQLKDVTVNLYLTENDDNTVHHQYTLNLN